MADESSNIGLDAAAVSEIAEGLSRLLADTYVLYVKTQGYHWNVVGPTFHSLHEMFEEEYIELRDAADEIAERIRALGHTSPGSLKEFLDLASVADGGEVLNAAAMVAALAEGHEEIARTARPLVGKAEKAGDVSTADLVTGRIVSHEKTAWMLRATGS
jgi:starvation-inducible DNA-binding protein